MGNWLNNRISAAKSFFAPKIQGAVNDYQNWKQQGEQARAKVIKNGPTKININTDDIVNNVPLPMGAAGAVRAVNPFIKSMAAYPAKSRAVASGLRNSEEAFRMMNRNAMKQINSQRTNMMDKIAQWQKVKETNRINRKMDENFIRNKYFNN